MEENTFPVRSYINLHIPCRYSYLQSIRQAVIDLCAKAGMSEFKTTQLEMAVDEASTNIIEHSYDGEIDAMSEPKHPGLRFNLIQGADRVVVEILDRGHGFNFEEQQVIPPDQFVKNGNERGLGMYIIKGFVDEAIYERNERGLNCLRLTKFLR